ncbi:QsdR family transcriptional regulator [Marinobacter sp. ATCH36]|uniref:QsdR family transcriptional regulator n=1 Tax=Marinobacter sp. ATCH36 TaxID=2945106 RepID=UPI0020223F8A|nr:QsdR family transcriptional regulator [Marinobacter sp. ATCH36]MCL7942499.1 QsdR family transcriptional regulator [Marinobacter sp. ATCH36]
MTTDVVTTRATPADVIQRTRQLWLNGERIHLASLSEELNIGRATLFRWVGSKDLLMGEALWSLYDSLRQDAINQTPGQGVDYVVGVFRYINSVLLHSEPLRRFIHDDPEYALKILMSSQSTLHSRTVKANTRVLEEQVAAGFIHPPMNLESLSYFMVRLAESCLYADIIGGREPRDEELEDACTAVRILLGGKA